jgi:hypothetical protein
MITKNRKKTQDHNWIFITCFVLCSMKLHVCLQEKKEESWFFV